MRELRGPKYRSARKLGTTRPITPTPFKVIRRFIDSVYGNPIIDRANDER
jgi:hypothetical protein